MAPNIQNEFNFRSALEEGFNLFLGPAFTDLALDKNGKSLPNHQELALELVDCFKLPKSLASDLAQVCTVISSTHSDELKSYLIQRFTVSKWNNKYDVLDYLPISSIITVGIDNLLFKVFENSRNNYLNNVNANGPSFRDRKSVDFIPLQGTILDGKNSYNFGPSAITIMVALDPDRWNVITEKFSNKPTIFLGFQVNDLPILQSLRFSSSSRKSKDRWIVLDSSQSEEGMVKLLEALGFQIITSSLEEILDYSTAFAKSNSSLINSNGILTSKELFPEESIPELNSISVRPIMDFYRGSPPQWSDIYLGNIHRTSHFNKTKNHINGGRSIAMIGIPGCGKTTLLMQLAVEDFSRNYKLVIQSVTLEKARLINNRLQGARALIFLDNFTDSLEAFEYLASQSNIQIIGSDRDYNFGIVNHRIDRSKYEIINITDLSPADIQECFNALPESVRRRNFSKPHTSQGVEPSIFEIMQENVIGSNLKSRFISVLKNLSVSNPKLCELLVVICYLGKARTPATTDILLSYTRDFASGYDELYEMCEQLGHMISEGGGAFQLLNEDQDFFSPRSLILSEAVIDNASGKMLQIVLNRFLKNVSPYRINRYDVFRRSAFDHRIISKAFPIPEEGMKFYEELYNRDDTPYTLQQEALYLSGKERYTDAFRIIDKAVADSGGRIWSIRNSHAIILFKANIDRHNQPNAREALKQSMKILEECYRWDKKRPFHALTFADQALRYHRIYGDSDAHRYLEQALNWLSDEQKVAPWNKKISQLLPSIKRLLI